MQPCEDPGIDYGFVVESITNTGAIEITPSGFISLGDTVWLTDEDVLREIYFEEMNYVLNTKGLLTKTANWLLQGVILNKIKESCKYSIQPNLEEGKKNMLPYLTNYSPMKGVFVNGKLNDFVFEKMELSENGIVAFITSSGSMKITIDGME